MRIINTFYVIFVRLQPRQDWKIMHLITIRNELLSDNMIAYEGTSNTIYDIGYISRRMLYSKVSKSKVTWVLMDVESNCILKNCNWNSISFDDCISGRKQQSKPNSAPFFCARNFRQYNWQQFQEGNTLQWKDINELRCTIKIFSLQNFRFCLDHFRIDKS